MSFPQRGLTGLRGGQRACLGRQFAFKPQARAALDAMLALEFLRPVDVVLDKRERLIARGRRALGVGPLTLGLKDARAQQRHRLGAVLVLRALRLNGDDDARRQMSDANGGFGLVDVLSARALGAHGVDLEIAVLDLDVDVARLGHDGDGGG